MIGTVKIWKNDELLYEARNSITFGFRAHMIGMLDDSSTVGLMANADFFDSQVSVANAGGTGKHGIIVTRNDGVTFLSDVVPTEEITATESNGRRFKGTWVNNFGSAQDVTSFDLGNNKELSIAVFDVEIATFSPSPVIETTSLDKVIIEWEIHMP